MVSPGWRTRHVGGGVGLRAGVRLHVGMLGAEELLGAVAGQVLDDVGELAAAVVALAGIAFRVFIGEDGAGGLEHGAGDEVLAGDHLQAFVLAAAFVLDGGGDFGIDFSERARLGGGQGLVASCNGGVSGHADILARLEFVQATSSSEMRSLHSSVIWPDHCGSQLSPGRAK